MINHKFFQRGNGMKLEVVITADDPDALGDALQRVVDSIGMARMVGTGASDEYAYEFQIYDDHRPELGEDDTYDEFGVNTKNSFNTPPKETV